MARIVIDPVTRIEGHLRIEAEVKDGILNDAWVSGTMFRGIEIILKDRDPRDAWYFTQRICGVCTAVHALASVRAVENALRIAIPENAQLIRNLIAGMQFIHDHVMHFYHLHALDWVDVTSAVNADPKKTSQLQESISDWSKSSPKYFGEVRDKLKVFVESGQLGIFSNGYWGHPAYKLPPEANLLAVTHYLEALDSQKGIARLIAILGGRHPTPNFLVGGMATPINPDNIRAINADRLAFMKNLIQDAEDFVKKVYFPDLLAIAAFYPEWTTWGEGLGNFLVYGDFPLAGSPESLYLPGGVIWDKKINDVKPFDPRMVSEYVTRSWYTYAAGDKKAKHPWEGETSPRYTGPKPPYEHLDVDGKYSWIKAPRYEEKPVEVGPLARALVGYGKGQLRIRELIDDSLKKLGVGKEALFSTLGRTLARGVETVVLADGMQTWFNKLVENIGKGDFTTANREKWEPKTWPAEAQGYGFAEAPRGTLGHWVKIKDGKILHYQAVVPTTWNASPRDAKNQKGAYEAALVGMPIHDPEKPLEVLRTIHSFDPCIACAVHLYDTARRAITKVSVLP
jgi:Ni,Fe-hydrogenase I large subunit